MSGTSGVSRMGRVTAAGVLLIGVATAALGQGPPARVRFDEARTERLERQREVTGELRAARRSRVAAEHEGLVVTVEVDVGDAVERGQALARLDDTLLSLDVVRLRAQRDSARAKVREYGARVAKARRDVERLDAATGKGGVSESELEDARLDLQAVEALSAEAQADFASAGAQVDRAEAEIAKLTIRAPFSGLVVAKRVEVGEWVGEGGEVFEMVDIGVVDAWLDLPQRYVQGVASAGVGVRVVVEALGRVVESSDVVVVAEGDALGRTFPVRVRLENPGGVMRPGMSVVGLVPTGEPVEALTVHKDAILRDDAGTFVYFDAGGSAIPIRIRKLWASGDRVVVEAERLAPGMRVVVEGNERLFPTQAIVDIEGAPPPGSEGPMGDPPGEGG